MQGKPFASYRHKHLHLSALFLIIKMKKFLLPVLAVLALSLLQSCSENFNVAAPYKSITVVYGLLDRADTAHYVRVQKAFLDENKSALAMAKEPDSSFFNNINVRIQRLTMSGVPYDTIHLTRVDLNLEGYPKDTGTFFNTPSYAYKFKNTLDPNYIYRIIVTNAASGETDSGDAPVIDNRSSAFQVYYLDNSALNPQLDFSSTNPNQSVRLPFGYTPAPGFLFRNVSTPVALAQGFIRFHWWDSSMVTGTKTPRSFDFDMGTLEMSSVTTAASYEIKNIAIYNAIKGGMGAAPTGVVRLIDRSELLFYLGTADFYKYLKVQEIQGTGLTGNEIQPTYTNLSGKNVLGLYTARTMRSGLVTISNTTIDSMKKISLLSEVKIVGTIYH